ncbi:MAG: hypothetical protein DHS20C08_16340 [Rhodomicrobium sp.]|nr:MAG: hypothetical protein DHS20C08_16340 [Rhodomicrobium sp.]
MEHIKGQLARHQNIILDGFDPVSAQGFTQVPNFILKSKDLSVGAKLTYAMLLSYAWANNYCFPGQATLAEDIGVSPRSVVTFIKELQQRDCISVKRQGLNKPNIYTLHLTIKGKVGKGTKPV